MDNDSPTARVERSFWAVWSYISGAVSRFFRPQPPNIIRNDQNSFQESRVDSEPENCGHAEINTSRGEIAEEPSVASVSGLSFSHSRVVWELCTTEIDLGPEKESLQSSRGSERRSSDEDEGRREEQFVLTGNEDTGLPVIEDTKEDDKEENRIGKLCTHGQDERRENDEDEENMNITSLRLAAITEDMEGRERQGSTKEENETSMTSDDYQQMDETVIKIDAKEEDNEMHLEDEFGSAARNVEVQVCTNTYLSQKEEAAMQTEEGRLQRDEADTAVTHEEAKDSDVVLLPTSKTENKSDEDAKQAKNELSVCEELSDDLRDFKDEPSFTSLHAELQMADDKSSFVSENELIVGQEHVMAERIKTDEAEDTKEEEDEKEHIAVIEGENENEATNNQTKDEVPEHKDDNKSVTEDDQEDISTGHICDKDTVQNVEEGERKANIEEETETAISPDDPQQMDETMTKIQVKEEEDVKMHHEDKEVDSSFTSLPVELQMPENKIVSEDELIVEPVMAHKNVSVEDTKERDDGKEQGTVTEEENVYEAANNQTKDEVPEQKDDNKSVTEDDQEDTSTGHICGKEAVQNVEVGERKANVDEETETAMSPVNPQQMDETMTKIQVKEEEDIKMHHEDKEVDSSFVSLPVESQMPENKIVSEDELIVEPVTAHKNVSVEDTKERDDGKEQGAVTEEENVYEAANNQTKDEVPEQNDDSKSVTEDDQEDTSTGHICGKETVQNVEEGERKANVDEETETAMSPVDPQQMDETMTKIQVKEEDIKMHHEDKEVDLSFVSLPVELQMPENKIVSEDELIVEPVMAHKNDIVEDTKERDDGKEQGAVTEEENVYEAANNQTKDEVPEQNDDNKSVTEDDQEDASTGHICGKEAVQNVKEGERKANVDEETETAMSPVDPQQMDETMTKIQVKEEEDIKMHHEDKEVDSSFVSPPVELQMPENKIVSEDELIVEPVMAHKNDIVEDTKERDDGKEQGAVIEEENLYEAANNQATDEMLEQEDDSKSFREGHVCKEKVVQDPQTELHTLEFTDSTVQTKTGETDDVETESYHEEMDEQYDIATTDIPVHERLFDKEQVEEEGNSSEVCNTASHMEEAGTITSTVKPGGETEQEMSGEFKNIPLGIFEGRPVVLQELNSPTCEGTQERVPEYNNEPGPDENTTQRFLEEGRCEEILTVQLPEEVGSKELESLQNSGSGSEADYLQEREHIEEEQESRDDIKNDIDLDVKEHAGILFLTDAGLPQETKISLNEPLTQELGHSFEEEEEKLLVYPMKTAIEHSEEEFEMHVGLTDESDKKTKEPQNVPEELLVEFETDEGLSDFKEADAAVAGLETAAAVAAENEEILNFLESEVKKMTEVSYFEDSEDAINLEKNRNETQSLLEDFAESGFLKQSIEPEPKLPEDRTAGLENSGMDIEETGDGVEDKAIEGEVQNKNEMEIINLQVAGPAAELTTESDEKEDTLIAESESLETQNQLPEESVENSNKEPEAADESVTSESKTKDLSEVSAGETESEGCYAEETIIPISGRQDVIDDEILDLWIETAMSEDTDGIKQQDGMEPGQEMDTEMESSNEEQEQMSSVQTEKDKEQFAESNTEESELVCDTDISSSTAESGFLDKSSTGPPQAIHDMSDDISELSTQQPDFASHDILMEETAKTGQSCANEENSVTETGFQPDSRIPSSEARDLNLESNESQGKTDEETGSQKGIEAEVTDIERITEWKDTEEADVKSLTEMSALLKVEETEDKDEPLKETVSLDTIVHADSGKSRSSSEASLEDRIVSTESGSQGDTCTDSEEKLLTLHSVDEPQPGCSEEIVGVLPELNKAEVSQEPTTECEDLVEVDSSMLDSTAQRSRIAVKNPRVRPPKDPRSLLNMPSVDPTPSSQLPVKIPAGVPFGGMGIGIKLPGLGAGLPVLKKTQRVVKEENSQEALSQEPEVKPEGTTDSPKDDETQHRPKWMPPRHPGFGNPLMSELKTKLKKTTKE